MFCKQRGCDFCLFGAAGSGLVCSLHHQRAGQPESASTVRLRSAHFDFSSPVDVQAAIGGAREASLAGLHPLPPQGRARPLSVRAMFSAIKKTSGLHYGALGPHASISLSDSTKAHTAHSLPTCFQEEECCDFSLVSKLTHLRKCS